MKRHADVVWKDEIITRDKQGKNARSMKDKRVLVDLITGNSSQLENKGTNKSKPEFSCQHSLLEGTRRLDDATSMESASTFRTKLELLS